MSAATMNEMERLREDRERLREERDAYQDMAQCMSSDLTSMGEERDALAAKLDRVCDAVCKEGAGPVVRAVIDSAPVDSLARLKAEWQANGAQLTADSIRYEYEGEIHQDRIADHADEVAAELRRRPKTGG